jgi:hypothetical protein
MAENGESNRTPVEKFILLFEAAKRSLLAAEELLKRLTADLSALEQDIVGQVQLDERAIGPLLSAVAFVDFAHRFGSIVDALPLVSKSAPELRQLRGTLRSIEDARNHLQHMRGDLSSNEAILYPILGALSWSNGDNSYTVYMSQPAQTAACSIVYDTQNRCWVCQHEYRLKDAAIDLDKVLAEMRNAYRFVSKSISDREFASLRWGKTIAFAFVVNTNMQGFKQAREPLEITAQ